MLTTLRKTIVATLAAFAVTAVLSACSAGGQASAPTTTEKVSVTTNLGQVEVPKNPKRVVALDNTSAETIKALGVKPVAVPKSLLAKDIFKDWIDDPEIKDVGNHGEPKFDVIEDVRPDLIVGGYRFQSHHDNLKKIADSAGGAIIDIAADAEAPGGWTASLVSQTVSLGAIFDKPAQAQAIVDDFNAKLAAAKTATKGESAFLAVVAGGKIDNAAARLTSFISSLNLKDVFGGKGGDLHQNSGLTPEAIAQANPDWVIVLDRDAAVGSTNGTVSAEKVFKTQEAFRNLDFMKSNRLFLLDGSFYVREGIQCFGENYARLAQAFASAE